jgi:hypothetical protein
MNIIELAQYLEVGRPTELELLGHLSKAAAELRRLAGVEAELAALQQDVTRYRWLRDTPEDASDFLNIRGNDFDHAIDAAMQAEPLAQQPSGNSEQLPLAIEKAEMVDDLAELLACEWFAIYSKVALAFERTLTDGETLLIKEMRQIKARHCFGTADKSETGQVFAGAPEDFKDWPEDRGEHPQKGLGVQS